MDIADPQAGSKPAANEAPEIHSDRYRVQGTLGAGGMGVVYLAEDLRLHRQVAIKKLREEAASDNARQRIRQEARLLAQLNHPNIVALYDVLETSQESDNGNIALVMEYIDGTTLRAWMREHTPSLQQKLQLLMQICQGLQQAHDLGIIHRDLKPDNILIATSASGKVTAKITDFGIAKSQQLDEKTLTAENQLAGTVTAMSPEQVQGNALDARSDLFSLGTIAYELLCGSRPFEKHEGGALAMANRIVSEPHTPPQQAWAEIPEPLAILLDKLLAKDPAQRPGNALIVFQGFELLYKQGLESDSEDYTATLTDLFTHHKAKSRRRWQRVVAGIAASLVVGAGGYWGWKEITRLEPQYIAVMPVEINGEIRGEENAKALTKTMVRQALMNSVSQLKASALVSFTPKEGQDFDAQLQVLQDKGVTDALRAQLQCEDQRCEIELQRIDPQNSIVKLQKRFTFINSEHQAVNSRITNTSIELFAGKYNANINPKKMVMSNEDYEEYLNIAFSIHNQEYLPEDLIKIQKLLSIYPQNYILYRTHTELAIKLFTTLDDPSYILEGEKFIILAKNLNVDEDFLTELSLWLSIYSQDPKKFQITYENISDKEYPTSYTLNKYSHFLYNNGNYEQSINYAERAYSLNPSIDNLHLIAVNLLAKGKYLEAEKILKNSISSRPNYWNSYETLGGIYIESGSPEKAIKILSQIPTKHRTFYAHSNLGTAQFLQKDFNAALLSYKQAAEITPNNLSILGNIAETLLILGNKEEAISQFQKIRTASKEKPGRIPEIYYALALAYLGNTDKSIPLAHELNKSYPDDSYAEYYSAQIYILANEHRSATYYISKLIEKGFGTDFFSLPVFQKLCPNPNLEFKIKEKLCK